MGGQKTYFVTGAGGFVGSNLVRDLLSRNHRVVGIDNFETGRRQNLDGVRNREDFEFIEGDICNRSLIEPVLRETDYLLHQAAVPSVPRSVDDPVLTTEANCLGTTELLSAAVESGVEKIVVASSSSVYGPSQKLPKREDMPVNPVSPYALSKYWTEKLALQFDDLYEINAVALRYFNVFGPRQNPADEYSAVVPAFINRMLAGEPPVIYGDGEQSRDFTYIENVCQANRLAIESDCHGEVLNVACGNRTTINELVAELNDILGTDIAPIYDDERPGDVRHAHADISKANNEIRYTAPVDFRDGLERTVTHYRTGAAN